MSPPPRPFHLIRILPVMTRIAFAELSAYRGEMLIWILTTSLPLVMLALWEAAAQSGPIQGFAASDFARYFAFTLVIRQFTGAWLLWELNHQIRTGSLSPLLLRPLNPLYNNLIQTLCAIPFRMGVLLPILAMFAWFRPEIARTPSLTQLLFGLLSLCLAFCLSWLIQACMGLLSFWFEQSTGLFTFWLVLYSLFGGYVIPLDLLPQIAHTIANYLPFQATLAAPVELLLGLRADPGRTLLVQGAWVALFGTLAWVLWNRGIRRYGAVGA
jgi:ABC-2 type transport system permease protein